MNNDFIPKGQEVMRQAVEADNADELEKALHLYKQGLTYLITGVKYVKTERNAATIREKIAQYMQRAEQLQELIAAKNKPKPAVMTEAGGGGGAASASKDKDGKDKDGKDEDPDTAKLVASLEGAIVKEKPNVSWDDVAGLDNAKKLLKEAVIMPVKFPQLFTGAVKPWKGILLYGPPGTGKSYIAKAVATEAGASCFLAVSSSDLVSKYQGESERLVKNLFELARKHAPSIVFIDEVDSLCSARGEGENESARRIKTEFLVQMDGVGKGNDGVLVLGATNVPWELDPAIRRRFQKRVYIPLPEANARAAMFKIHSKKSQHCLTDADFARLGRETEGFSGSDLSICVKEALYAPVRMCQDATHFRRVQDPDGKLDYRVMPCSPGDPGAMEMSLYDVEGERLLPPPLTMRAFVEAARNTKPSVAPEDLARQEQWTEQFGMEG